MTDSELENLFAHFHPATLYCMRRDIVAQWNDETDQEVVNHLDRLLRRINHMIEEKS